MENCKRNQCVNKGCNWIVKNKGDECVPCKSDKRCHMPQWIVKTKNGFIVKGIVNNE